MFFKTMRSCGQLYVGFVVVLSLAIFLFASLRIRDNTVIENGVGNKAKSKYSNARLFTSEKSQVRGGLKDIHPFMLLREEVCTRSFTCTKKVQSEKREFPKKHIVFYNKPDWWSLGNRFSKCEYSNCELVHSQKIGRADLVIFDGVRLNLTKPPPRPSGQIWVVIGNEAPLYYTGLLNTAPWMGVFNWTSTHRVDSDIFAPYGLLVTRDDLVKPRNYYASLARSKTKLAIFVVSHCSTLSLREEYVKELQQYLEVDIFGNCGTRICSKYGGSCLVDLIKPYVFILAFENALCSDYVTEKFFRTFHDDFPVIPVVRGGTDYHRYFPNGTFIDSADFSGPEELAKHLKKIAKDKHKVADMLREKSRYRLVTTTRHCHLCYLVNKYNISSSGIGSDVPEEDRLSVTKTYQDVYRWLLHDKCFSPTDFTSAPATVITK